MPDGITTLVARKFQILESDGVTWKQEFEANSCTCDWKL